MSRKPTDTDAHGTSLDGWRDLGHSAGPTDDVPPARREPCSGAADGEPADGFPIVGIGASAGGIEALVRLFEAMPPDTDMAFLVVVHLDPTRDSGLAHILGQHTKMTVVEAADGMAIEPDHVYVITPDASLTVGDGRLWLTEPKERRGHRYPIDRLFSSLAQHKRERAICIVLSGTGSDGTEGLKEVKAQGGCILVQDPATARFGTMPSSAIAAGLADHVLAPEQIPGALARYVQLPFLAGPDSADGPNETNWVASLDPILALLRTGTGQDFRNYKPTTLIRRTHRRMGLNGLSSVGDYVDYLRSHPAEIEALSRDLMISVTGFFRDREAWTALDETVVTPLVEARDSGASIRIWVPACATGQEAYSLAMLLADRAARANKQFDIKVFATDGRADNLEIARAGIYSEGAVAAIPPDLLGRFFGKLDDSYEVRKEIRDTVVFAAHNLLRDPPFCRIDLISCRNLLIYLDPEAQRRALALLHFALRESGYLFLGNAETIGGQDDLFHTVSKRWRIYRRLGPTRHGMVDFPALPALARRRPDNERGASQEGRPPLQIADLVRRALVDRFAPASVLVDGKGRVLWFHGETGNYLTAPPGEPSRDILAMARDGLRIKLRDAMRTAASEKQSVERSATMRHLGDAPEAVTIIVTPVTVPHPPDDLLLVSFRPGTAPSTAAGPVSGDGYGRERENAHRAFEEELETTRSELQDTIAEFGRVNQELKAANEEVTSMNEELQSTNEELETSREEMQSFNEELQIVNTQLQHKVQELEEAYDLLNNLLASSEIASVFLDADFCIKWFSPASTELLDLVPSDIGRPITHFAWKVADDALLRDAETVLRELAVADAEVRSDAGRWYLRRLLPYRTHDNRIAGVIVSIIDITAQKQASDAIDEARVYAETVIETVRHPIMVLDTELRVQSVNHAFCEAFACPREETLGYLLHELDHGAWDTPDLRQLLHAVLKKDQTFEGFTIEHEFPAIGRRNMLLNARRLVRGGDRPVLILLAIEDITARVASEGQRDILIHELSHRVKNMLAIVQSIASQTVRHSGSLMEFKAAFEGRLHALGFVHDVLVREDWAGADLGNLLGCTLEPHGLGERVSHGGPAVRLTPAASVAIAMVLHELATNAVKYGALSCENGRLEVAWRVDDGPEERQVHLCWTETGGPTVTQPSGRGFGTRLIENSIVHQLRGAVNIEFLPEGLRCEISFPTEGNVKTYDPREQEGD